MRDLAGIRHDSVRLVFSQLVSESEREQDEQNVLPWLYAGGRVRGFGGMVVN